VLASTISAFATLTLLTKNSFLDEIKKQYVMTAKAKGLSERRVLYGHVFRNAMLIVIAGFPAVFIGVFFGGSLIIETIFSLDGLGRLGFEAAVARDYPVIFGTLFVFGLIGLVVNILSDLMYVWSTRASISRRGRPEAMGCAVDSPPPPGPGSTPSRSCADAARSPNRRARLAVAAQPAALAQLQGQPPRLLVAVDLRDPLRAHAVRGVHRQRQADPGAVPGRYYTPIFNFYPETAFGGDFRTEAVYRDIEVQCLIVSGGLEDCFDDPEAIIDEAEETGEVAGEEVAQGLDALAARSPTATTRSNDLGPPPPRRRTATTGWAPTTRRATCWRG
jgi:hypothetical protein